MDFFEVVKRRASVRSFEPGGVSAQELQKIVDAGRRAPSGYNRQPWSFIIIQDQETIKELGDVQGCISGADAAIGVVVDAAASPYWVEDASAAIENMLLAIVALGYDSLWVEGFLLKKEKKMKQLLQVPDEMRLLAILPVGLAAERAEQAPKRPLEDMVHWERYVGET